MYSQLKLSSYRLSQLQNYKDMLNTSPHQLFTKNLSPRIDTVQKLYDRSSSDFHNNNAVNTQIKTSQKTSSQNSKKILILDDSVVKDFEVHKKSNDTFFQKTQNQNKTIKKRLQPLNPFQQILQEYDTPDFNMTLPFVQEFSKIDLKSPTFSDIFNLSEMKSPQVNNQNSQKKFFIAPKKCQKQEKIISEDFIKEQIYEDEDRQIIGQNFKLDYGKLNNDKISFNKTSLISEIKISKPLETPKKKSSQKIKSIKPLTSSKFMSQQTYKLKNHQNPSTPRIKNIYFLLQQQNQIKTCQKMISSDESLESNPQIEGILITPSASYNEVKNKISPRLRQSFHVTDNLPTKRSYEQQFTKHSSRNQCSRTSPYKRISIKKLQLEEQLQEIYNGKFKLNRTMRF